MTSSIAVAPDMPIFRPADRSLLVAGASVSLSARLLDEVPTAERISAGRNGVAL